MAQRKLSRFADKYTTIISINNVRTRTSSVRIRTYFKYQHFRKMLTSNQLPNWHFFCYAFLYETYSLFHFFVIRDRATTSARHASAIFGRSHCACPRTIAASGGGAPSVQGGILALAVVQSGLSAEFDVQFCFVAQPKHQPHHDARRKRQFRPSKSTT